MLNMENLKNILIIVLLLFASYVGYTEYSNKGNAKVIQSKAAEIKGDIQVMHDTLWKHDTIKIKADTQYEVLRETLWVASDEVVDSIFDVTFEKDSIDTTVYTAGISQFRKAIDVNLKFKRDSTKLAATEAQVRACTTTVKKVEDKIDTIVKIKTETSYVSTFISFIVGGFVVWVSSSI